MRALLTQDRRHVKATPTNNSPCFRRSSNIRANLELPAILQRLDSIFGVWSSRVLDLLWLRTHTRYDADVISLLARSVLTAAPYLFVF
jgi:hypothetical protein